MNRKVNHISVPFSFVLSLLTLVVGLFSLGCTSEAAAPEDNRGKPVRVETIKRGDITDMLVYPATLRPYNEVRIFSTIPDLILDFPWDDGDEVKRGDRVALIKRGAMDQGLESLSAQVEGLDAQIANTESELDRTKDLLSAGAVAQAAFDRLETQLKSLRAQKKAMIASRSQLAVQAGNAYITAPISGVIANKSLEKGDMAVPQMPLCRIIAVDRLKVETRLVETDVHRIRLGQEVKLHLDAFPERPFDGKVTSILPYLDPATRTNTIEVSLDNPKDESGERLLKPGMYGRAEFIIGIHQNVVLAPEPSLLLDNEILAKQKPGETLRRVFVVDAQNIAHRRDVRCGARKGSTYEILEGLKEGDHIVTRGQHGLQDGQSVEVMDKASE